MAAAAALAIAVGTVAGADLGSCVRVLSAAGPMAFLAPLPFVFVSLVDAVAWRIVLGGAGTSLFRVAQCRVGLEAFSLTVPGGALAADGLAPTFLSRRLGISLHDALTAAALKKWGIISGHALVLLAAGVIGVGFSDRLARAVGPHVHPMNALFVGCAVGIASSIGLFMLLRGGLAEHLRRLLTRLPSARAESLAARCAEFCSHADAGAARFFATRSSGPASLVAACCAVWLAEACEVWALLALLGAEPRFPDVLALEALVGLGRAMAFFSPGGLGVQEIGYLSMAELAVGSPSPGLGAALTVLRRARDVVFIVIGYVLLGWTMRGGSGARASHTTEAVCAERPA